MFKKNIFLILALALTSCGSHKNTTLLIPDIEIENFNGKVKSISYNSYISIEEPQNTLVKSDFKNVDTITYKGNYIEKSIILNKLPCYKISFKNANNEISYLRKFHLKDSITTNESFIIQKDRIISNIKTNTLNIIQGTVRSVKNQINTYKVGKQYVINEKLYSNSKKVYHFNNKKLTSKTLLNNKDTISKTTYEYYNDKLKKIHLKNYENNSFEIINIEYLEKNNLNIKTTITNNSFAKATEKEFFDKNNLILKSESNIFFKKKRYNGKSVTEYFYKRNKEKKDKNLYKKIKTETFSNLVVSKTTTLYYDDGLIKENLKEHVRNGKSHFKFEYDFDVNNNWTHKYYYDLQKKGITKVDIRNIQYF